MPLPPASVVSRSSSRASLMAATLAAARPARSPRARSSFRLAGGERIAFREVSARAGTQIPPELPPSMLEYPAVKSARRDPQPDPGQADRRGPVRGAQAEPRRGVQDDRLRRSRCPASARARCRRGSSTSGSAAARCCRRPSTRPCRSFYGQAVEENKVRPLGQPEVDVTDVPGRGRPGPEVHRRGRRAPRDRAARLLRADRRGRRRRGRPTTDVEERLTALRQRFGTLDRRRARRRDRRLRLDRPVGRRSAARRSTRSRASPTRSAPAT